LGQLDNTLVIYIVGDNGASAEGSLQGLLNEMVWANGIDENYEEISNEKTTWARGKRTTTIRSAGRMP